MKQMDPIVSETKYEVASLFFTRLSLFSQNYVTRLSSFKKETA